MANYNNRKRDEEEERKRREAEAQAAQAQTQQQEEPAKEPEPVKMATQAPAVGAPSPRGIPKPTRQQRFEIKQNVADQKTSTQLVQAGELDMLPEKLEPRREEFEEKNKAGKLGSAQTKQWSSAGNEINVDVGSIKDVHQLAYFGTTLVSDADRRAVYKKYAEKNNLSLEDVYYQAEQMTGGKAFDAPQSNKGKLAAVGLYNPDGTILDPATAKGPEIQRALRMVPDSHPGKAAAEKALVAEYGWVDDSELGFLDSADLTKSDFDAEVKEFRSAFTISDGETEANTQAYLDMLDEIDVMYSDKPAWVRAQLKGALDREYSARTGVLPPDESELRAAAEEAANTPDETGEGEKKGFFGRIGSFVRNLFAGTGKAPKAEEAEEEETEEEPEDLRSGVSEPTYYASATVSSGVSHQPAAPEVTPSEASASEAEEEPEMQGPAYQPQAAQEQTQEQTQEAAPQTYVNAIAYDPEMTDAQALAYWKRGATLDERNKAQIAWFTGSRNAQGITAGTGMYSTVMDESGQRKAIDVYSYYGNQIGAAVNVINSGSLPEDIQNIATLELGSVIDQIDRIVADPQSGITIPKGQNMYSYVLSMPEYSELKAQVDSVTGVQNQVNDAYAEQAIREEEARLAQIERDKAAVASGNATPDALNRLAEAMTATDYIDLYEDKTYAVLKAQMNPMRINFFGDEKPFWQNGSAAAQEGLNLRKTGGYSTYKDELMRETQRVLDDYTEAALMIGMTLKEYLGSAGIDSLDQIVDIAYNNMQARGNAYREDGEAQEAAATIATTTDATWGEAIAMGAESGAKSYAADFMQTTYMALDAATYNLERMDIMNRYIEDYGYEYAAARYYSDLMAYANSGKMDEASKQDLLDHMARAANIFDVAFEIDATGIEGWARTTNYELSKDVDALAEIAQSLPKDKRAAFNLAHGAVNSVIGMGVSTAVGGVTGSALIGSAVAYGTGEWASAYDANRAKGMSPGMAGWMALGNAVLTTAANRGGTGSQMEIFFGEETYKTFYHALQSESGMAFIKAFAGKLASQAHEEGMEEVSELLLGKTWDLLDEEALAIDSGADFSLSRTMTSITNAIEGSDPVELFNEVVSSYGMGAAMGGVFSLAGTVKTAVQARRGVNAQRKYASIEQAAKIAEGKITPTEENLGSVYAALKEDLNDPKFRRWIDSASKAAKQQRATVTAIMSDAGSEERHAAVVEAQKANEYAEKAQAATTAAENATNRWIELRQQVASGDLSKVASMESARMLMGKAQTAKQEATTALEKAKESARAHMNKWLTASIEQSGVYKSQEMERRANQLHAMRMQLAQRLSAQYEAEEAARQAEVNYAESQVFPDEEWQEDEADTEIENMSEDEIDMEIVDVNSQIADAEARIAEVTSRSEELGLDAETEQALIEQELAPLNRRKEHIIAREKSRFNNAFERMQTALEMDDGDAADQIAEEYDRIGERLNTLGVNTEELIANQYGYELETVNEAAKQAQEQEAQRAETQKQERLTDSITRRMEETIAKAELNTPARRYLMNRPIYVNKSQASDILAAEGLKSIPQFNRRYHTQLTTDENENAMPLDGHVMNDINTEAAGSVDESADPVSELLRVMQTGRELAAEQKAQQAEAKELAEKKKAADKRRRERVYTLTGRDTEPVRQANQINALVANENSTVEQIDSAVDRIEGVSMSMSDGAEAAVEQGQETTVESGFKDPTMQKLASDLYKNWGIRLRTADLDQRDEGFYDRDSNTIVLNKRLTSGEKQRMVIMHELIHFCEGQAWYPQFKRDILAGAYSSEAEIEENRERLRDMGYAEKDLDFELVAHAAKPLFEGDEVLIGNLLENGKASAVKRAYAAIAQYISRRKAKKMGMGKRYDALLSARKTLAKGLKSAKATKGGDVQRSVQKDAFGKAYVKIDKDILAGVPQSDWETAVKNALGSNFPNGIKVGNYTFMVTEKTKGEWTRSGYSQWLYNNDRPLYEDKMRAADNADELLLTAEGYVSETPKHPRKDKVANFSRGTVRLSVGGKDYSAEVVTGGFRSGRVFLYDIVNIRPISIQKSRSLLTAPDNRSFNRSATASDNSIQNSGSVVNTQSMQNGVSHSYSGPVLSQYGNKTAQEIDWINQAVKDQLKGSTHEVQTDRAAIVETLSRIEGLGGVQDALRDLMSRPVDRWNAQDQAMAQVLMAKAEYDGDVTTEAVVSMMFDKSGSEAGLTLQKRKLLARMDSQNAFALASRLASDFNIKNGGSSQYAPVGNGQPLEKSDAAGGDANRIIDRAKRVNDAIAAERGMDDIVERQNRWGIPVTGAQMYLIERYGLTHTDLPGAHYSQATVKQRMLAAILSTDTDVVYDTDVDGNRNGLLGLIQQLEAMKAGKAVQTIADLTYISNQMSEMKAQSNGSEDPYLNTQEAKIALSRAYDAINNVVPVTMGQRSGALAYMNMLSASTTGVKNVLGNVVMGPMEAVSETIATVADKAISAKTKNRTTAVSTAQETATGLREGLAELANTFADAYIYQTDTSYGRKYEMSGDAPRVYQNAPMEAKRRMVDFIMQLGDRPFFKAEYARQMEMIQRLCAEGKMKKKDVVSTPDGRQIVSYVEMTEADMHKEAAQRALERVFQEDNAIVNWINSAPAGLRPFMQAVVPFVKTPTNIAKRMLDYSPIGLAKTLAAAGYHAAVKDGGFDQRKFVMGVGRGLTGTGMIMAGALLSSLGILDIEDGYGEEDDSKLYGAGMANYDPYGKYINIGGNKMSLDWLGAAGIWMTIGAAAAKEWDEDTGLGEAMYSTMLKSGPEILNLLFDNTMLSSVSELLGGAEDGKELGTNVWETIVGSALQQYFSPADIRQFAKFTDEYERDYRNDNPFIEAINKNVIRYWPVLRQTLPIKYDITGDAVRQSSKYGWGREDEDVALNFLNMYMSPTNIQSDKGDVALDEVIDLSYRLGDTSCIPNNLITTNGNITIPVAMAKKTTLGAGENKLTLNVDEQRKYNQMYASLCFNGTEKGRKYEKVGAGAYGNVQGIRDLIESRAYQRASDQARADMIAEVMKQAKEIVRAQICIDRGYEK